MALPPAAATTNPVDLAGGGEQDFATFERVVRRVLDSGEADTVLLTGYFGGYSEMHADLRDRETAVAHDLARAAGEARCPLVVHSMFPSSPAAQALRAGSVPVYREVEAALDAVATLARAVARGHRGVPPAQPHTASIGLETRPLEYEQAREIVAAAGVPLVEARLVTTAREARAAAGELGYPVVLKALGLLHKSDQGGVALALATGEALEASFSEMTTCLQAKAYSVERMADLTRGAELIVGCKSDPRFGPVVLVGFGGILAELVPDTAVALAPAEPEEIEELLRSLRGAAVLAGARGRPALAVRAAAEAAAALSRLSADRPELAEVEVNPLLVTPEGAIGLDARVIARSPG
jgi:acyl-CoA synthetase (NDP forming)